jgi:serine/threonine protein kinase
MENPAPLSDGTPEVPAEKPLERDPIQDSISVSMTTTRSFSAERGPAFVSDFKELPSRLQDRYAFRKIVGQGGFGCVFEAWDEVLRRTVAIKLARRDRFDGTIGRERFLEEARAAARLNHPHIVTVHDSGTDADGNPFVVFEYISGESLAERIKHDPLSLAEALEVLITVADAVHAAHKAGLVHRDLKPANILLDASGRAYVTDFGLAVDEHSQRDHAGEVAGSPQYMSPEQLRGETHYLDGRTDIWSLGVILYEMLAHRRPFSGRNLGEVRDEILNREPKPLRQMDDSIPIEVERICLCCLKKAISERFTSAADLQNALKSCRSVPAPKTEPQPAKKPNSTNVLLISAVILFSAAALLVWRYQPHPDADAFKNLTTKSTDTPSNPTETTAKVSAATETAASTSQVSNAPPIYGKWVALLSQPPKLLDWPIDSKNSRWHHDPDLQELWVACDRRGLLKVGHVASGDYQVQVSLFQSPWAGGIGFCLGRHELEENGKRIRRVQLFELQCPSDKGRIKYFLHRTMLVENVVEQRPVTRETVSTSNLPAPGPVDQVLRFEIQKGRVTRIHWGEADLRDLLQIRDPNSIRIEDSYGDFGVYAEHGSGVFRKIELFLQPKGDR